MGKRRIDPYERKRLAREKAAKDKIVNVTKARSAANDLLNRALKSDTYTIEEKYELSNAVRSFDRVLSGWCNKRRR